MTTIRKKLIEVSIPLEVINEEARRRKQKAPKGYPTSIHKYWAQRPVAACRAFLFAQLVDDPSGWPDRFPTIEEQAAERRRLHRVIEDIVPWEASGDETKLNAARWEIARSVAWGFGAEPPPKDDPKAILDYLQTKAPPVYDPFCGAGSIPLEAQRLGLRTHGSDLNPLAVLISKALVEIPTKFAGMEPINPEARAELVRGGRWNGKGAQALAEDVRFYSRWMRAQAKVILKDLYPHVTVDDGSQATVIAWMWVRTIKSPDPALNGVHVPLVSSFLLSTKGEQKVWVEIVADTASQDGYRFDVHTGNLSDQDASRLKNGTKTGRCANFRCALSGTAISDYYVKSEGIAGRLGQRLMAIIADAKPRRIYLSPTADQEEAAACGGSDGVEGLDIEMSAIPRWFSPPFFGLRRYIDLFTERQIRALSTLSNLILIIPLIHPATMIR
jgi:putative DNA methylase